jgi:hypothetical protein
LATLYRCNGFETREGFTKKSWKMMQEKMIPIVDRCKERDSRIMLKGTTAEARNGAWVENETSECSEQSVCGRLIAWIQGQILTYLRG